MTRGQAVAQWFDFPAAEQVARNLTALAVDGRHPELFADNAEWVRMMAQSCEDAIDAVGLEEFVWFNGLRKPYTKPDAWRDEESFISGLCARNPHM